MNFPQLQDKYGSDRFLILPRLFSDSTIDNLHRSVDRKIAHDVGLTVVDDLGVTQLICHADLFHGGGQIQDPSAKRKSLVCHCNGQIDCDHSVWIEAVRTSHHAYGLERSPPPAPLGGKEWLEKAPFPEERYLERNSDVGTAVESGQFESGRQHHLKFGHRNTRFA